jgi:hypothetical protein
LGQPDAALPRAGQITDKADVEKKIAVRPLAGGKYLIIQPCIQLLIQLSI